MVVIASFYFALCNGLCYPVTMAHIELHGKYGEGKVALVDDELLEWLSRYNWTCTYHGYARATVDRKNTAMHRLVVGLDKIPRGKHVDHINRIRLDNRRENLRIVSPEQNTLNSRGPFNPGYTPTEEDKKRWEEKAARTRALRRKRRMPKPEPRVEPVPPEYIPWLGINDVPTPGIKPRFQPPG